VAVLLAGDAGLRVGEIRALTWPDVDLVGETITVNQQMRHGVTGTPKGRTRRVVSMTAHLRDALRRLEVLRRGYVVRNLDGTPKTDGQTIHTIDRIYKSAGLKERGWHALRHTFGTDAARFGVTPWMLMTWMGHKRIDETMRYVNLAHDHRRPIPSAVLEAGAGEGDPDLRALKMLSCRGNMTATEEAVSERA
jgi:integrase